MTLVWFEGFETCGDETGSANASLVRPNIDKRITVATDAGTGDVWLEPSADLEGFGLSLGALFNNRFTYSFDGSSLDNIPTGPSCPIITVGARVHIPDDPTSFTAQSIVLDDGSGGSTLFMSVAIENSTDVVLDRGSSNVFTEAAAVTPGEWVYLELAIRPDGAIGNYAVAEVASAPADLTGVLPITNFAQYLPVWRRNVTYNPDDMVRWMGKAYTADGIMGLTTSTGEQPDLNPSVWTDNGDEDLNTDVVVNNFQPSFYILEDPEAAVRVANAGHNDSTINSTTVWDYSSGEYIPQPGDKVIIGSNSFYELRVGGSRTFYGQLDDAGQGIIGFNIHRRTEGLRFSSTFGVSGVGQDFVGYDDIYLTFSDQTADGTGFTYAPDFRGPANIISLPMDSDVLTQWTTSTGITHFSLINENGADASTYVETSTNAQVDRFGCEDLVVDGEFSVVRVEVEAINTTSGSPTVEVSVGDSGQISTVFDVTNTADSALFVIETETAPGGGSWAQSSINALQVGVESAGF